jgi:hypothetical protein
MEGNMFHPSDADSLSRMLGTTEHSASLEGEYLARLRLFHADGRSGPIGTTGLVDLIRCVGEFAPAAPVRVEQVDWRALPQDGTTRVVAKYFGQWLPGTFRGFVENGTLAILLDDDAMMKECRKDMVRLAGEVVTVDVVSPEPVAEPPVSDETVVDAPVTKRPVAAVSVEPIAIGEIPAGAMVLIEDGGDVFEAKYMETKGDVVRVLLNGESREFPLSYVVQ